MQVWRGKDRMHIYILQAIKDKVVRPRNQINSNENMSLYKRIQGMIFTNKHTEFSTLGFLLEEVTG